MSRKKQVFLSNNTFLILYILLGPRLDRWVRIQLGTFWGVLNVSLCASGTQLGLARGHN